MQFNSEAREAFAETAFDASISIVVDRLRESGELDLVECDLFVDIRIGDERKTVAVNYLRYVDDDSFRMDYSDTQPDPRYADRVDYVELEHSGPRRFYRRRFGQVSLLFAYSVRHVEYSRGSPHDGRRGRAIKSYDIITPQLAGEEFFASVGQTVDEGVESRRVVVVDRVTQLVNDYIVAQVLGQSHQIETQ